MIMPNSTPPSDKRLAPPSAGSTASGCAKEEIMNSLPSEALRAQQASENA